MNILNVPLSLAGDRRMSSIKRCFQMLYIHVHTDIKTSEMCYLFQYKFHHFKKCYKFPNGKPKNIFLCVFHFTFSASHAKQKGILYTHIFRATGSLTIQFSTLFPAYSSQPQKLTTHTDFYKTPLLCWSRRSSFLSFHQIVCSTLLKFESSNKERKALVRWWILGFKSRQKEEILKPLSFLFQTLNISSRK